MVGGISGTFARCSNATWVRPHRSLSTKTGLGTTITCPQKVPYLLRIHTCSPGSSPRAKGPKADKGRPIDGLSLGRWAGKDPESLPQIRPDNCSPAPYVQYLKYVSRIPQTLVYPVCEGVGRTLPMSLVKKHLSPCLWAIRGRSSIDCPWEQRRYLASVVRCL